MKRKGRPKKDRSQTICVKKAQEGRKKADGRRKYAQGMKVGTPKKAGQNTEY